MAKGRKSPHYYQSIDSKDGRLPVLVQGSRKTLGICDIQEAIWVNVEYADPRNPKKKRIRTECKPIRRLSEVLSKFQGRQLNSPYVQEELKEELTKYFNPSVEF